MSKKVLFIDPVGGFSGDMFLGAFLDLGLPLKLLRENLEKIGLGRLFSLNTASVERHGIAALKVDFPALVEAAANPAPKTMAAVKSFLTVAALPEKVTETCFEIFHRLAAAEAKVHGSTIEKIHFHEVGDYDTLADIVGVATALDWCGPELVSIKPVPLGTGFVDCAHGRLPIPVPAVVALLEGLSVVESGIEAELVTPTGAAIFKTLVELFPTFTKSDYKLGRCGYGAGSHQHLERPNLLRLTLGSTDRGSVIDDKPYALEPFIILEVTLDDMTPEKVAALQGRLLTCGALDVVSWPVAMKKGRLGVILQIILRQTDEPSIVNLVFSESPTLGIRRRQCERYFLEREIRQYRTIFGEIRCKIARDQHGKVLNIKPEHDDLVALAERHVLPLTRLEQLILSELQTLEKEL
ncbi:MAG: nickel pincer cofactor biosynthesis protein LarC [Deltaproteobacteria bacterium]|nr:nickel pincer cofactor biosynthesis protein LarC [Candidatus Tharpella sp.]